MTAKGTIMIAVFVDDLVSVSTYEKEAAELFQHLSTKFTMTGGDPINWMAGINIVFPQPQ